MKYDFIKNGFKEGDTVYSIIRGPGIIKSINKVVPGIHSICVKFNNLTVTYDGYGYLTPGDSIPEIFPNEFKVTVPEDMYKTPIKDKELVWCWDNEDKYIRTVGFFDGQNESTFDFDTGTRCGDAYDNYERYEGEWPDWAKEAVKGNGLIGLKKL